MKWYQRLWCHNSSTTARALQKNMRAPKATLDNSRFRKVNPVNSKASRAVPEDTRATATADNRATRATATKDSRANNSSC